MRLTGYAMSIVLAASGAGCAAPAAPKPPVAPVRPVLDEHFGVKVTDPYRYFEDFSNPEVRSWVMAQGAYAAGVLGAIPGRDKLLARIAELDEGAPFRVWVVRRWPNGDLHYLRRLASENLDKLYFLPAGEKVGGPREKLLIDPERFTSADGKHASISFVKPSPDGMHIAYGIAMAGSEQTVLRILNVETGTDLPEVIDRIEHDYMPPAWLPDGSGFYYSRRRKLPPDAPATEHYKGTYISLHRLGTPAESGGVAFDYKSFNAETLTEDDFPAMYIAAGSRFAVVQIKHGDAREITLFAAPLDALSRGQTIWTPICKRSDEVVDYAVCNDRIYLTTAKDAPTFKVVQISLASPDLATAEVVIPSGRAVVRGIDAAKDALYVTVLDAGVEKVLRTPHKDGKPTAIAPPAGEPSISAFASGPDTDGVLVGTASWTRAGRTYLYDPEKSALTDTGLRPAGKFDDVSGYESAEVMAPSHDGVKVPLSIVHRKGLKLDGSHPTLVLGYGAYGASMSPHYDPVRIAWLERGGVLAYANVRGGGALGKPWHLAGQKTTKPNTWKDFIACCEYLVKQGYTSPGKLAGQGGSAGGILIGRAITERPDLFAAAIANVGCLDAIRMETTANGVPNIQEFGTVTKADEFRGLLTMSAYAHVIDGVKYPAVLLTHGLNDPRVEPWQSAKMTARLQAATASGKPVLFRVDVAAGHGIGSTKRQRQEQRADEWAFLLWQMGEKVD